MSVTIFDALKAQADEILDLYPDLKAQAEPFDTVKKIITLYYVKEKEYYQSFREKAYPHNIPPWGLEQIKELINLEIAKYTLGIGIFTVESYMSTAHIEQLFQIFVQFVKEAKELADQQQHQKHKHSKPKPRHHLRVRR